MSDQQEVSEYQLDTLTQATRFVAGIAPRAMTRVTLGVALAAEDAATDPAGELLGIKLTDGAKSIASTLGSIARASTHAVRTTAENVSSPEGKAARAQALARLDSVPGVGRAREFLGQAGREITGDWNAAGVIAVELVDEEVDAPEIPALAEAGPVTEIVG